MISFKDLELAGLLLGLRVQDAGQLLACLLPHFDLFTCHEDAIDAIHQPLLIVLESQRNDSLVDLNRLDRAQLL